ncbi:MAG: MDR family MFS transporter, partial [Candidatus Dormibacteria bacterium]
MLSTGLVALDSTIIATAVPSVVHDLGGFSQYPWLFSTYLLTQAVTVPLYGKLADVLGRRPVMFFGIGIFLLGSLLCGVSWNMPSLIVFRALQGIGAGAVQPMSMTVVGDLYSVSERSRVQGYLASVWGVASVLGPTLGGLFSQYLTWRLIFIVNLPLGALACWVLVRHFHEGITRRRHRVDFAGVALLSCGCSVVLVGLIEGGTAWPWLSLSSLLVGATGMTMLIAFGVVESRATEPILPLWAFRQRTIAGACGAGFGVGALLIGLSAYIPTYVQGTLGASALVAGFTVASLNVGWPLAATVAGRIYLRIGFRDTALIGAAILVAGTLLYNLLTERAGIAEVAGAGFVVGAGMGLVASPTLVAVQSVVSWGRRGVVTGAYMFARSLGSAAGAAVFGAVAKAGLAGSLRGSGRPSTPGALDAATSALSGGGGNPHATPAYLREALYQASHAVFLTLVVVAAVVGVAVLIVPRRTRALVFDRD